MSSANVLNLDEAKILSFGNGLSELIISDLTEPTNYVYHIASNHWRAT